MMRAKKKVFTVPPKVSYLTRSINGKDVKIKLVRDSLICKIFSKKEIIIVGNTIYCRKKIVNKHMFDSYVKEMADRI